MKKGRGEPLLKKWFPSPLFSLCENNSHAPPENFSQIYEAFGVDFENYFFERSTAFVVSMTAKIAESSSPVQSESKVLIRAFDTCSHFLRF